MCEKKKHQTAAHFCSMATNVKVQTGLLVVVLRPEVSRGEDVEGQNVRVNNGLIRLWCVSNSAWMKKRVFFVFVFFSDQ